MQGVLHILICIAIKGGEDMNEKENLKPIHPEREKPEDIDDLIFLWESEPYAFSER